MISGTTLRSRLLIFGGLYFAQRVPWGFFTVAIVLRLTSLGLSPAGLGKGQVGGNDKQLQKAEQLTRHRKGAMG